MLTMGLLLRMAKNAKDSILGQDHVVLLLLPSITYEGV
jgi:hypothetical protein